ncbi:histidine kinase N-terminal domain-containing protein [Acetobacterium carbinolicum]|jgi:two-component sensor histidine kinase|uniref:histidine kinase N-terminal domain-containing protein n=1 Tax=Acetobacterium TaxID=33951 RepID=UPI000DBEC520|nr:MULTISPECIES: histidine kinase N-terminal domain-containing protein [unclassified Acetobacterium]AWW25846.1 hypothetical protein DOZ58_03835 [Acetobacterium sp. KB-1]MDK2941132.1 two-component system, sensor histidine kinase PdtaS [Acetobacterium sp.]MDZ5725898.1 histidine kinase N-terminal domain-containing protein [Acetobacterium sp. K1/6]
MKYKCDREFIIKQCKEFTLLNNDEIEAIIDVAKILPYFNEGFDGESFIDIKVHDKDLAVVVAESYKKKKSIYVDSYLGDIIYRENEPAVFRSFDLGVTTKDIIGMSFDRNKKKIWTKQTVVPIMHNNNVVATLILEKILDLRLTVVPGAPLQRSPENEKIEELWSSIFGKSNENEALQLREGILIFDETGHLKYFNQRAVKMYQELGFKSIENQHFDNLNYTTKNFDDVLSNIEGTFSNNDDNRIIIEKSYDGKVAIGDKFYRIHIIIRMKKTVDVIVFIDDITEMRKYEKEVNSYLVSSHEIHHRIKNNLQTVASLLRLQSRNAKDPEVKTILSDSINRIMSIAVTHELLEKKSNNLVSVQEMLDKIKQNMISFVATANKEIEISVKGADFFVDSEKSTVIALIVNELIQNSLKYAFPNGGVGHIEVTTASDGKIKMIEVKDNGIGYKSGEKKRSGLGLNIVKAYVYEKLLGKLIIETGDEGTTTSFAFKL